MELVVVAQSAEEAVRLALASLALAGCNAVFGVQDTKPLDAFVTPPDADPCSLHPGDPGFHDEDGDGFEDRCDMCPGVPNPDQADTLEAIPDGVGDACDPSPSVTGDRLALFITFEEPNAFDDWSVVTGNWAVANGSLVHADPDASSQGSITLVESLPAVPLAIETKLVFDALPDASDASLNFVTAIAPSDGSTLFTCEVYRSFLPAVQDTLES